MESESSTVSQDRLKPDKRFLLKLTKLETVIIIKRYLRTEQLIITNHIIAEYFRKDSRSVSVHAREMLDHLSKREYFWKQLNK